MKTLVVIYTPYKLESEKKALKKIKKQFKNENCKFLIIENDYTRDRIETEVFFNPYQS